jgi:hypothetical protein
MSFRKLLDGSTVEELSTAKKLTVYTKCPEKWKLIDLETGEEYLGFSSDGDFDWKKIKDARH